MLSSYKIESLKILLHHTLSSYKIASCLKFAVIGLLVFFSMQENAWNMIYNTMYSAYAEIGTFVISTLLIIYAIEKHTSLSMIDFLRKHQKFQVPIAAMLGILPGCGGSILIVTQYAYGGVTFGAMVATLITTMGDAAILLIRQKPYDAIKLFTIVYIVGVIVGYIIDRFSKEKFFHRQLSEKKTHIVTNIRTSVKSVWATLFCLTMILNWLPQEALGKFFNNTLIFSQITQVIVSAGLIYSLFVWTCTSPSYMCDKYRCQLCPSVTEQVTIESSFIITWIFLGLLGYNIAIELTTIDFTQIVKSNKYLLPILSIAIGLLPGCGPQIVVTTLYISGAIPFSVQLANAISNDGDALIPAIALCPKKAFIATLYGIIPAVIIGYAFLFIT